MEQVHIIPNKHQQSIVAEGSMVNDCMILTLDGTYNFPAIITRKKLGERQNAFLTDRRVRFDVLNSIWLESSPGNLQLEGWICQI